MSFQDILLHIDSYPEPPPPAAIDTAVAFAKLAEGRLTALALTVDFPVVNNRLADLLLNLSDLEKEAERKSRAACEQQLKQFEAKAKAAGVFADAHLEKRVLYAVADVVARHARTRDLCVVPLADPLDGQASVAVATVFGSGRPVLVYKASAPAFAGGTLGRVVLAWDGSPSAARAMSDALPILAKAQDVKVLSVIHEKPAVGPGASADVLRHLRMHGVAATSEEVEAGGRRIGEVLTEHLAREKADLLVMGAYGHSRVREFILGGATEYILHDPPLPVLLSH